MRTLIGNRQAIETIDDTRSPHGLSRFQERRDWGEFFNSVDNILPFCLLSKLFRYIIIYLWAGCPGFDKCGRAISHANVHYL